VERLLAAEGLVLVFPIWWFGFPAVLKGWFDRVWAPGFAYCCRLQLSACIWRKDMAEDVRRMGSTKKGPIGPLVFFEEGEIQNGGSVLLPVGSHSVGMQRCSRRLCEMALP